MGQVVWASEVFNCSAPDTGNMEILYRFGSPEQKELWLKPLLEGKIRSCFAMTEPEVASSDARNICLSIEKKDGNYIINGKKWYISGAGDIRCTISIVMGKQKSLSSAHAHSQQSMVLVPMNTPGVIVTRAMGVFGQSDAPHGHMEIEYRNVVVPCKNILCNNLLYRASVNPISSNINKVSILSCLCLGRALFILVNASCLVMIFSKTSSLIS